MKLPGMLGLRATSVKNFGSGAAAIGMLAFAAQAEAADIYAPPPPPVFPVAAPAPLWSGLYGGAHVGGAWADLKTSDLNNYWSTAYTNPVAAAAGYGIQRTDQSPSGVFGGGTVGYNMQRGGVVFGLEADFGYMDLNRDQFLSTPYGNDLSARSHISTGFYGDVTGRLGWAWGPWLIYGKGGLAVLEGTTNIRDPLSPYTSTNDDTRVGWTAGGGFEYLWNPAWSVKVEYQYFDFGTASSSLSLANAAGAPITYGFNHDLDINTVKFGINYHLGCCDGGGVVPLK